MCHVVSSFRRINRSLIPAFEENSSNEVVKSSTFSPWLVQFGHSLKLVSQAIATESTQRKFGKVRELSRRTKPNLTFSGTNFPFYVFFQSLKSKKHTGILIVLRLRGSSV